MSWFFMNMPAVAVIFGLWVGIPLWIVFRYPHRAGHAEPVRVNVTPTGSAISEVPAPQPALQPAGFSEEGMALSLSGGQVY